MAAEMPGRLLCVLAPFTATKDELAPIQAALERVFVEHGIVFLQAPQNDPLRVNIRFDDTVDVAILGTSIPSSIQRAVVLAEGQYVLEIVKTEMALQLSRQGAGSWERVDLLGCVEPTVYSWPDANLASPRDREQNACSVLKYAPKSPPWQVPVFARHYREYFVDCTTDEGELAKVERSRDGWFRVFGKPNATVRYSLTITAPRQGHTHATAGRMMLDVVYPEVRSKNTKSDGLCSIRGASMWTSDLNSNSTEVGDHYVRLLQQRGLAAALQEIEDTVPGSIDVLQGMATQAAEGRTLPIPSALSRVALCALSQQLASWIHLLGKDEALLPQHAAACIDAVIHEPTADSVMAEPSHALTPIAFVENEPDAAIEQHRDYRVDCGSPAPVPTMEAHTKITASSSDTAGTPDMREVEQGFHVLSDADLSEWLSEAEAHGT